MSSLKNRKYTQLEITLAGVLVIGVGVHLSVVNIIENAAEQYKAENKTLRIERGEARNFADKYIAVSVAIDDITKSNGAGRQIGGGIEVTQVCDDAVVEFVGSRHLSSAQEDHKEDIATARAMCSGVTQALLQRSVDGRISVNGELLSTTAATSYCEAHGGFIEDYYATRPLALSAKVFGVNQQEFLSRRQ